MILVVGSTGIVGGIVTRKLCVMKRAVTALVRDPKSAKASALKDAGAKLAVGDLKDRESIQRALAGVETVICTASATLSRREGDSIETVDRKGNQDLIRAARTAKVPRFVYVSYSRNMADDFPLGVAKREGERMLESSGLDYVILLPSCFIDVWTTPPVGFDVAGGKVRIYGSGDAKISYITVEDVASAVVAALDNPKAGRRAIPIGGPMAVSQRELVGLFEKAAGKKIQIEQMAEDEIQTARAGTSDPLMSTFLGLFAALARGDEIPSSWASLLNVRPTSAADWVKRTFPR